jgi:hypothetical protein
MTDDVSSHTSPPRTYRLVSYRADRAPIVVKDGMSRGEAVQFKAMLESLNSSRITPETFEIEEDADLSNKRTA